MRITGVKANSYADAPITAILWHAEVDVPLSGLCRDNGMSNAAFCITDASSAARVASN